MGHGPIQRSVKEMTELSLLPVDTCHSGPDRARPVNPSPISVPSLPVVTSDFP